MGQVQVAQPDARIRRKSSNSFERELWTMDNGQDQDYLYYRLMLFYLLNLGLVR